MSAPDWMAVSMPQPDLIRLHGPARKRGLAHGRAVASRARAFLDDGLARLNHVRCDQLTLSALSDDLAAYGVAIRAATPALWDELEGFAQGAGLTLEEAILLQTRREVMGYTRFPAGGDCTSLTRMQDGQAVLAQTVDLTCEMADQISLLHIAGPDIAGGSALVFSFTGLLGYLGVNAAGLSVGLNLVMAGDWGPGLPPYLAIRHLIDRAHSVDEALAILRGLPLASSRNFVLCDRNKAMMVEAAEGELRLLTGPVLTHANHFLHPDFVPKDGINPFARNSSVRRQAAVQAFLGDTPGPLTADAIMGRFATPPVNVSGPPDMRREKTVAAVVMDPSTGRMTLRCGDPAQSQSHTFSLCELAPQSEGAWSDAP
ncbi:MAG: C45 family autoproteolytic acyltransferase/hydrolase [Paracoccaceae bacterium]